MAQSRASVRRAVGLGSLALLTAVGALALTAGPAAALAPQTRYVETSGSDGTEPVNDCLDQDHPCKTIQHAVDEANSGDTVSVGAGTFAESVQIGISITINGSTTGTTTMTGGVPAAIFIVPAGENFTDVHLNHLSVTGDHVGAGILAAATNLTVTNSLISDNVGAGVESLVGTLAISNTTVSDTAFGDNSIPVPYVGGAGVAVLASAATIDHSTLKDNEAAGLVTFNGELILGRGAETTLAPPEIPATTATLTDSTVSGNGLGGVVNDQGTVAVETSTVSGNTAGGVVSLGGTASVKNSTVSDTVLDERQNPQQAGLIALPAEPTPTGPPTNQLVPTARQRSAMGSTVAHLLAGHTPAVRRMSKTLAPAAAPAPVDAVVSASGSIVAKQAGVPDCLGPIVDDGYNLSSDAANSCKFSAANHDLVKTDPKLGSLADNGGPTLTQLLKKGSPAIDAIASGKAGCVADATDQRGIARPQPTGEKCDIGSVELAAKAIVIHPNSLPHGTVGTAYHATLTATGGAYPTYAFSLAPGSSLPDGLALSSSGHISGTPTKAGSFAFTVSVNDPVLKRYTIVVDAAAGPDDNGNSPIANTGTDVVPLSTAGGAAVLAGLMLLVAAGVVGRRPGRHRAN
jgi:hypothetical protein